MNENSKKTNIEKSKIIKTSAAQKIIYWLSTSFLLLLLTWSVISYHVIYDFQAEFFRAFGYPTYLIYPLAYMKLIALLTIVSNRYNDLREMVYAALFLNMVLALVAHINYQDFYGHAVLGLICLPLSYLLGNQVRGRPKSNLFGHWTDK